MDTAAQRGGPLGQISGYAGSSFVEIYDVFGHMAVMLPDFGVVPISTVRIGLVDSWIATRSEWGFDGVVFLLTPDT